MEEKGQQGGGVQGWEDGEGQRVQKDGEMRDQMNGYQRE